MEVFSLLKYWRTNGGATTNTASSNISTASPATTTIRHLAADDDDSVSVHDDGPFFDLEFTVPEEEQEEEDEECDVLSDSEDDDDDDGDVESIVDFTVDSSCSTGNRTDPNLSLSPSDDLFFNSRFVPLEPSELGLNSNEPSSKLQFPGSLRKPATKLRVLMLGFKKSKCGATENPDTKQKTPGSVTVKLKVEEVPIVSLFTRDNSSRNSANNNKVKNSDEDSAVSDDKKFAKDVLQKYLKMVKPLYFRVSKRYGEKSLSGFSGQLNLNSSTTPVISSPSNKNEAETIKETEIHVNCTNNNSVKNLNLNLNLNLSAGIRNVRKHLVKSRSASSAVAAAPLTSVQSRRHDDSLLQQQDGIQSAILHCKRSFTASRESDSSSALSRCTSDPSHEKSSTKSVNNSSSRNSLDETRVKL